MYSRITITLALLVFTPIAKAAFEVPVNDGFITDSAGILTEEQENVLETQLNEYRSETSNEIAILIVQSMSGTSIADAALEVGRKWGVGTSEDDNGILILIAYADHEILIATGYGLEGAVPDIVAKGIIDEEIAPHFRDGQYFEGLTAGVDALKKHIGGEYAADRYDEGPGGNFSGALLFFLFIGLNYLAALFGRTKSWWLGGVVGGFLGIVLTVFYSWWLSIPALTALGLLFDYIVSKNPHRRRHGGFWGGGFGGRGGGGGGFGGFGGGSFGGGGARGRW